MHLFLKGRNRSLMTSPMWEHSITRPLLSIICPYPFHDMVMDSKCKILPALALNFQGTVLKMTSASISVSMEAPVGDGFSWDPWTPDPRRWRRGLWGLLLFFFFLRVSHLWRRWGASLGVERYRFSLYLAFFSYFFFRLLRGHALFDFFSFILQYLSEGITIYLSMCSMSFFQSSSHQRLESVYYES